MHESGIGPYGWRNRPSEKRKTVCAPLTGDRGITLVGSKRARPHQESGVAAASWRGVAGEPGLPGPPLWRVKAAAGWHTDTRFEQPLPAVLRCLFPHLQAPISSMPRPPMGA